MQSLNDIKQLLASVGTQPKKRFGQNFLHDHNQLQRIIDAAAINPADGGDDQPPVILEVGSGTGALTEAMLEILTELPMGTKRLKDTVVANLGMTSDAMEVYYEYGDFDSDGAVGEDDLMTLLAHYDGRSMGDFNGDGVVDAADYTVWRDAFAAAGAAVPEPSACVVALGAIGLGAPRRR